jgi:octaprenyl-diphosphate synthase
LAAHSQWGNDITVLLGDFLYIKSMSLALTENSLDLVRLLCDVTLRMIEGELYQLTKNGDIDITEAEHFDIIRRKTAYLFAGCAEIGGRLGTSTPDQWQALREYGFNLGTAFQLMDDLLDFTGDAEALGKPVGGDLREGKVTLPLIRLLASDPDARPLVARIADERSTTREQWAEITRRLRQSGALDYALASARDHALAARRQLAIFPATPERDALEALADYVLHRDR